MIVWYHVDVPYAVFGLKADGGKVVEVAPIGRWMLNMSIEDVSRWVESRHGTIVPLLKKISEVT